MRDLTGQKFGKLTAIKVDSRARGRRVWLCQCDCGNEHTVINSDLTSGNTKSCGCMSSRNFVHLINYKHGMAKTPFYDVWINIRERCENINNPSYKTYGAKGITVSKEWHDFNIFYKDMYQTYKRGLSIDRIDNTKGYHNGNCKWSTRIEQNNNKSNNILVTYKGVTGSLAFVCRELDAPYRTIRHRIKEQGLSVEDAFTKKRYTHK